MENRFILNEGNFARKCYLQTNFIVVDSFLQNLQIIKAFKEKGTHKVGQLYQLYFYYPTYDLRLPTFAILILIFTYPLIHKFIFKFSATFSIFYWKTFRYFFSSRTLSWTLLRAWGTDQWLCFTFHSSSSCQCKRYCIHLAKCCWETCKWSINKRFFFG